ncbi:MAG TPA: ATP-binding protein [Gaiellaceae bacterium]|nr:ATP-binding protein [Gaiellaceae bacterium]
MVVDAPGLAGGGDVVLEHVGAADALERLQARPGEVDAIVVSSFVDDPVALAQRMRATCDECAVVLIVDEARLAELRRAVRFAPFLGDDVVCVADGVAELVEREVVAAARRARDRRRFRADLAAAEERRVAPTPARPSVERYLANVLELAPLALVVVDEDGRVAAWNRKATELLGRTEREALGAPAETVFPRGTWHRDASPPGPPQGAIVEHAPRPGDVRFLHAVAAPFTAGPAGTTLVVIEDVSERERLYREVRERAEAAEALEAIGEGVALVDGGAVIRLWNPAAAAITGVAAADAVGRPIHDVLRGWPQEEPTRTPAETGRPVRADVRPVETADGEVWLSIVAVATPHARIYAFRDVSDERRLDELKSDFVATVSHELRTPLAAIYGIALTFQREGELPPELRAELVATLASQAERLRVGIDELLLTRQLEVGGVRVRSEAFDLGALVADEVAAARQALPRQYTLTFSAPDDLPRVRADPDKVRQILANLIDNAAKYSQGGGTVAVELRRSGGRVRTSVTDEGIGIPRAERQRVFDKFYRADPAQVGGVAGTGLGLYVARELVRLMDGRIWVDSEVGRGSTFSFELPAADGHPETSRAPIPGGSS